MKPRENIMRLKRFYAEEKRRRVMQIEAMIAEFSRMASELDHEIGIEEQKAGVSDPAHFAYPTYARAARTRRDNLLRSAEELSHQLIEARSSLEEALADLDTNEKAADLPAEQEPQKQAPYGWRSMEA